MAFAKCIANLLPAMMACYSNHSQSKQEMDHWLEWQIGC